MSSQRHIEKVSIRPGVSILSVLRHLNYKPWFALAEFVDNAIQSFLSHRAELERLHGKGYRLKVRIDIDATAAGRITVTDNAAGISSNDFGRAFRPAAIPPDRKGLSEFGMGMKSAACWFAPRWEVHTSALDEPVQRIVSFDISRIVHDDISELEVQERSASADAHGTKILLLEPHKPPVGRTIAKIKEHLTDIYRVFVREGMLELRLGNEVLEYQAPKILVAPYFKTPAGEPKLWRKEINFSFGGGLSARGFAAIREVGSVSRAGFALFRRGRLIQGSGDEGYRPEYIFKKSNSYEYQRIFGELHLEGFDVSHTKDGFRWDENEQPFLELLKERLDSGDLPLLQQAAGYRARASQDALATAANEAVRATAEALEKGLPGALEALVDQPPVPEPPSELPTHPLPELAARDIEVSFRGQRWLIHIELTNDAAIEDWITIAEGPTRAERDGIRKLGLRLSLAHEFMVRFAGADPGEIEALLRVAAAMGLAVVLARESGVRYAGMILRNVNMLLTEALSSP